jgi:hypothetical protein
MAPLKLLKIAILINTDESHYITLFKKSYLTIFTTLSPTSTITFYDPVTTHSRLKPANCDLLIIGGGTYVVEETTPLGPERTLISQNHSAGFSQAEDCGDLFRASEILSGVWRDAGFQQVWISRSNLSLSSQSPSSGLMYF